MAANAASDSRAVAGHGREEDRGRRCRVRHAALTAGWRDVLADEWLRSPAAGPLRRMAQQGIESLKRAAFLLHEAVAADDLAAVEPALDHSQHWLDRLHTQAQWQAAAQQTAAELHGLAGELLSARTVAASKLWPIARRVILAVTDADQPPEPGLPICAADHADAPAALFARGIETARLLVWCIGELPAWSDRLELLTAAALLQDVGCLVLPPTMPAARRDMRHPAVGAALVSGLRPLTVELPALIAAHHERFDGTGIPAGQGGPPLSTSARLLTAAVRFSELWGEEDAAARLAQEARQGAFDLGITRQLLTRFAPETAAALSAGQPSGGFAMRGLLWWPDTAADPVIPAPHLAARIGRAARRVAGRGDR